MKIWILLSMTYWLIFITLEYIKSHFKIVKPHLLPALLGTPSQTSVNLPRLSAVGPWQLFWYPVGEPRSHMMCCVAQKIEIKKQNMLKNDAGLAAITAGGTSQIKELEENSLLLTCLGAWSAVTTTGWWVGFRKIDHRPSNHFSAFQTLFREGGAYNKNRVSIIIRMRAESFYLNFQRDATLFGTPDWLGRA